MAFLAMALTAFLFLMPARSFAAIYWVGGSVMRANNDGSLMQERFVELNHSSSPLPSGPPESVSACEGLAVDGSHIYWAEAGHGAIARADLDGRNVNYNFVTGLENPCGVAVDATKLYWVDHRAGTIGRANLEGGEVEREFVTKLGEPCGIAVGGGYLYWTDLSRYEEEPAYLGRIPVTGGIKQVLYEKEGLCGVAVDAAHVYWGGFEGAIGRAELDGDRPEPEFITGIERPCGIALAGPYVYWSNQGFPGAAIGRTEIEGSRSSVSLDYKFLGSSCGIALDDRVIPAPQPPTPKPPVSNLVGVGRIRHGKSAPATFVTLKLPQAGSLTVNVGKGLRTQVVPSGSWPFQVAGPQELQVKFWPARGRRAKAVRAKLRRRGRLSIVAMIHFAVADGSSTRHMRLPLVEPRPKRR